METQLQLCVYLSTLLISNGHLLLHIILPNLMQLHFGHPKPEKSQAFPQDSEKSSFQWNNIGSRIAARIRNP